MCKNERCKTPTLLQRYCLSCSPQLSVPQAGDMCCHAAQGKPKDVWQCLLSIQSFILHRQGIVFEEIGVRSLWEQSLTVSCWGEPWAFLLEQEPSEWADAEADPGGQFLCLGIQNFSKEILNSANRETKCRLTMEGSKRETPFSFLAQEDS